MLIVISTIHYEHKTYIQRLFIVMDSLYDRESVGERILYFYPHFTPELPKDFESHTLLSLRPPSSF